MEYTVKAEMPGLVARTTVKPGDEVEKGQEILVINCMKTELSCTAPLSGTVREVMVEEWDELEVDTPMIIIESN
ncbi:MAG: acetyl-CoA carboxylase biotin carboxyl carrier protein subunit [Lachnospiraceae bacterium]|nr:acetyl-CoA carboxylase biotin carboxyl carrier protein subunit [Lachnospiraceae bacterium]